MGLYINRGNEAFKSVLNGEYVDKSPLISVVNKTLDTEFRFSCVTRCRRFGKSMAAKMLNAYYDQSCDSRSLFADLQIASDPDFDKHLNKYPVIYLDLSDFVTEIKDNTIVKVMQETIKADVHEAYPDVPVKEGESLMNYLFRVKSTISSKFIFIIDEWDAICREFEPQTKVMDDYVDWLRRMFKSGQTADVFAGAYLTGILPIKKYKTESALNNFIEYSMVEPRRMARYFGFTKDEVRVLASKHGMDFCDLETWYDGYQIGDEPSMFNPNSVMQAINAGRCRSFWGSTGAFGAVKDYINMNYDGLKDDILKMLGGGRCYVDPTGFQNDMSTVNSRDDVLTVLIHLGYLAFNWEKSKCYIPNKEVESEMVNAVKENRWGALTMALDRSRALLDAVLEGDEQMVAQCVDLAHDDNTSILSYNNENSLACVLSIAFYYARGEYVFHRELPTGKGFVDLVLLPRKNVAKPALLLELKCNADADAAIDQIRRRQYPAKLADYTGDIILVGINYDKQTKQHTCRIETLKR